MFHYDNYNREERAICAHLFRLLHEQLEEKTKSPLGQLLKKLSKQSIFFGNMKSGLSAFEFNNVGIFCEVSIIRDVYQNLKPSVNEFMDKLTQIIMKQEKVKDCRLYSQLDAPLNSPSMTHPKQIKQKAISEGFKLTAEEMKVYGAMQGMFNAKPDLVITVDNKLITFEAKFTEDFDGDQLERTINITEVWANLIYKDLGFGEPPEYTVLKLGAKNCNPHISWTDIFEISKSIYKPNDRTYIALCSAVDYLKIHNLE